MDEGIIGADTENGRSTAGRTQFPISRRHLLQAGAATAVAASLLDPFAPSTAAAPSRPGPDENGYDLWLRYREVAHPGRLRGYRRTIRNIVVDGDEQLLQSAGEELGRGLTGLLGQD